MLYSSKVRFAGTEHAEPLHIFSGFSPKLAIVPTFETVTCTKLGGPAQTQILTPVDHLTNKSPMLNTTFLFVCIRRKHSKSDIASGFWSHTLISSSAPRKLDD